MVCRRFFRPVEGKPTTLTIEPPVGDRLEIPCVVCWARKHGRYWEAGLAFHTLTPGQARVLGDFVMQSHRARSAGGGVGAAFWVCRQIPVSCGSTRPEGESGWKPEASPRSWHSDGYKRTDAPAVA